MFRKANFITVVAIGTIISSPGTADYQPRPHGWWMARLILKPGNGPNQPFELSRASYPETCAGGLKDLAAKVEGSNGYVWTDKDFTVLSYYQKEIPGWGKIDIKSEVVGIECTFKVMEPGN
jgi:hypothetical protein